MICSGSVLTLTVISVYTLSSIADLTLITAVPNASSFALTVTRALLISSTSEKDTLLMHWAPLMISYVKDVTFDTVRLVPFDLSSP